MIAQAQQRALQRYIPAKQVEWRQFVPGRRWDTESLAAVSAAVALACHKRRLRDNLLVAIADALARALGKAES